MDKKIEFQCAIYMNGYGVNIYSNYPEIFDTLQNGSFTPFIPEYRCLKTKAKSVYSLIYIKDNLASAKMLNNNKTLEIKGPLKDITEASTIPFRAHFLIEAQLQKNSIFTTEGSGVSRQGRAILLMGKSGAGKTSITLELCRKHSYNLIGNDLVLVGLKKNRGYFLEGHSGIIKALYVHLLNDKNAPLYIQKAQDKKAPNMGKLYLYKELSSYIRGICTPIIYGSRFSIGDYLPSLDKPEYHQKRIKFINWLNEDIGFYYISGSMSAICGYINKEIS